MIERIDKGLHIRKASALYVTPYVYDNNVGDFILGNTTYDIKEIIGDSIEIMQDDAEVTIKKSDVSNNPLLQNTIKGNWKISFKCIDFCNKAMETLYGFNAAQELNGESVINAHIYNVNPIPFYALIRIKFNDELLPNVILPKVYLGAKIDVNSLKKSTATATLSGTAEEVKILSLKEEKPLYFLNSKGKDLNPKTDLVFLPDNCEIGVFSKLNKDGNEEYILDVDGKVKVLDINNGVVY